MKSILFLCVAMLIACCSLAVAQEVPQPRIVPLPRVVRVKPQIVCVDGLCRVQTAEPTPTPAPLETKPAEPPVLVAAVPRSVLVREGNPVANLARKCCSWQPIRRLFGHRR